MGETGSVDKRAGGRRVLVAEDSAIQAEQLRRLLVREGFAVTVARDGAEGLARLEAEPMDLVVSDVVMPGVGGFEFCRRVKAERRFARMPFILLTSLSESQDLIRAVECGADQFVMKPYDERQLLATIRHSLADGARPEPEAEPGAIEVVHGGQRYAIAAGRARILNLLISTYEAAMAANRDLIRAQEELRNLNDELEAKVDERTAALRIENAERRMAEEALREKNAELNTVMQQLWQASKLATMGELASSIAHEMNNPLAIVSLRIESLVAQMPDDDPRQRELAIVGREVERMGTLVANLLQFSRRNTRSLSSVDVAAECERTLELVHYHLRKGGVRVVREFGADVPLVLADRQQLRQLFLNLFTNAADAMPEGGTLTVRVAAPDRGRSVCAEIVDSGGGIAPAVLSRVLEPFFTTKPEGKGTGLGLPICRRIVQEHRGTLEIASDGVPGRGTTVRVVLPSIDAHGPDTGDAKPGEKR